MKKNILLCVLALCAAAFTACDHRNIKQVVKEIAEAPADTLGMVRQVVQTNDFSVVEVDCFADVTFHQTASATAPYVVLRAHRDVLPHVGVKTLDDMVIISTDRRYRMPERAVVVIDIYAPFISKFMLNGGKCIRLGDIRLKSPLTLEIDGVGAITANVLKAPEVDVSIDGAGSIDLKGIETERLAASINGAGQMFLAGHACEAAVGVQGTGGVDYSKLKTDKPVVGL